MCFTQTDGLFGVITSFVLVHYIVCYHVKHTILTHFTSIDTKKEEKHSLLLSTIYLPETKSGLD